MAKTAPQVIKRKLADLTPDSRNANLGSPRGNQMIEDSLRRHGAGRSILLDKHGNSATGRARKATRSNRKPGKKAVLCGGQRTGRR